MSLAAERALIGGLMVEPGPYAECAAIVTPEEFADPAHGQIWAAMGELVRSRLAPEPEAVLAHLNGTGDPLLVAGLYRDAIGAANAIHYAGLVHTAALRRRLADLGERLLVVRPDDDVDELLAETRRALMDLERD